MDRNSCLQQASRTSSKRRVSQTSRRDANPAAMLAETMADLSARCLMRYAHRAASPAKFLSSRGTIARYTAAIVSPRTDNSECSLKCALRGAFFIACLSRVSRRENSRLMRCGHACKLIYSYVRQTYQGVVSHTAFPVIKAFPGASFKMVQAKVLA